MFMLHHEVQNPLLEVVKHAVLNCMQKVELRQVAHNARTRLIHVESSVSMMRGEFSIGFLAVGIAVHYL
jgi:hypothetical protein